MKQTEQLEKEKNLFLSLCCHNDRDMLTGKADMTLQDFERITYLTMALGFTKYALALHEEFLDFTNILSEQLDREHEIIKEYPTYYLDAVSYTHLDVYKRQYQKRALKTISV